MNVSFETSLLQLALNDVPLYVLAIVLAVCFIVLAVLIVTRRKPDDTTTSILQIQQQIESIREQMDKSIDRTTNQINVQLDGINKRVDEAMKANLKALTDSSQTFSSRLESTATAVKSVEGYIGKLEESNKRIFDIGKDISGLQELLKSPKLRGGLGELMLERLLAQILPSSYFTLQYTFSGGERVDAVIHIGDRFVCVDSKFPLESFRKMYAADDERTRKSELREFYKSVRKHIDDIARKYIRVDEGSFGFAFMYIPAENVYYETIAKDNELADDKSIQAYAMERHVIPVSPNSFYAYLYTVSLGLKGLEIEKNAEEVIGRLRGLSAQLGRFQEEFGVLGTHIRNAQGKYESADKQLTVLDAKIDQISQIDQPQQLTRISE